MTQESGAAAWNSSQSTPCISYMCESVESDNADVFSASKGGDVVDSVRLSSASNKKQGTLDVVKGTGATDRNREYDFERKGQFVIVYNDAFDYTHRGIDWGKQPKLNYPTDAKNIKSTFKLDDNSLNLKFGKNLTPYSKNNERDDQFDGFVDELLEEDGEPNPSFLMFFLMSHGDRDGEFLLSENSPGSTTPCCEGDNHTFSERCRARKVYQLVQKIDSAKSKKFLNIPKIFIIQACRGGRSEAIPVSKASPVKRAHPEPTEADRFIPECSDVFIFYACIENQLSWVANTSGSFAVKSFCESIADTTTANNQSNTLWSKLCEALDLLNGSDRNGDSHEYLKALNTHIKEEYRLDMLKLGNENVADGWIEGICRQATVKVTDFLIKECDGYGGHDRFIKQQPQYASTLRFKLSMLKLLDTQS